MLAAIRSRLVFAEQLRRRSSSRLTLIINVAQRLTAGVSALASSLVRFSATQDSGRRTHASAWYPFATRPDFGVAAYANNHDGIGITCIFRVRDVVNPRKRTLELSRAMSALCQKQTFFAAARLRLLDHLIGAAEKRERYGEAERLSGLHIDG